jgi:hypothetical protein
MASPIHPYILTLDRAARELGVVVRERGLNRRIISLYYANATWDVTPDGDKVKVRSTCADTSVLLWEERHSVEYVVEVLQAQARRQRGNASGAAIA